MICQVWRVGRRICLQPLPGLDSSLCSKPRHEKGQVPTEESLMSADQPQTFVYAGLAGEGEYIGAGGLCRYAMHSGEWQSVSHGLPENPQVRALLIHPQNPAIVYAGTHKGPYRSDDRGEHWTALDAPPQETDVWSL